MTNVNIKKDTFYTRNKFFCFSGVYLAISVLIYVLCRLSENVADFMSVYVGGFIRQTLALVSSLFPFSLAEALILLLLPLMIIVLFFLPDRSEGKHMSRNSYVLLGCLFLILAVYFSAFAPCYFRKSVSEELSLDRESITKDDVYYATTTIIEQLERLEPEITSLHTGQSIMPLSYSELVSKLNQSYDNLPDNYDFLSDFYSYPKPLAISPLMPYTRISGFYTFFSGEANVSTAYPDFMLPYTMAHEMAHQRGIAREDEANFIAFIVCITSDNAYIQYSGYTELLNYLLDALYKVDKQLYSDTFYSTPKVYRYEYSSYVSFVRGTYSKGASTVTGAVNNAMLQSQGQTAGEESYNLVTTLVSAYYKSKK